MVPVTRRNPEVVAVLEKQRALESHVSRAVIETVRNWEEGSDWGWLEEPPERGCCPGLESVVCFPFVICPQRLLSMTGYPVPGRAWPSGPRAGRSRRTHGAGVSRAQLKGCPRLLPLLGKRQADSVVKDAVSSHQPPDVKELLQGP